MARQDANESFSDDLLPLRRQCAYIEQLYARYEDDAASVGRRMAGVFQGAEADRAADVKKAAAGASWQRKNWPIAANGELVSALDGNWGDGREGDREEGLRQGEQPNGAPRRRPLVNEAEVQQATRDSVRAIMMIRAYRMRGHLHAKLDPLGVADRSKITTSCRRTSYGFTEADYDRRIFIDNVLGLEYATIREMLDILKRTYCSTIGVEFMHISNPEEKQWIQERIEGPDKGVEFTPNGKKAILQKLVEAEGFEQFIDVKYKGTKRFGLDGGESLIPALEQIIKRGGQLGLKEIVLGMAHRGRLNVLTNVMAKPHRAVFHEFKGGSFAPDEVEGSGDVKYHLGASSDREFDGNKVHLSLTANPSHLEIVNPVVMGKARAKQDLLAKAFDGRNHPLNERAEGSAAAAAWRCGLRGPGRRCRVLGLSGLRGHRVAGTLHFIINNQIGFTTNPRVLPFVALSVRCREDDRGADLPRERRRSGSGVYAAKVATEFRMKFHKPVVIDMFCYRRFGHNEGDEPAFTQPKMYKVIRAMRRRRRSTPKLIAEGHDRPRANSRR
jgi:2-oxoglutarate dehydrogenase E1 component